MNYKLCLIGAKDTTISMAKFMIEKIVKPDCIITVDESVLQKAFISGFSPIDEFAEKENIKVFKVKDYSMMDEDTKKFFAENSFELGICVGWQRLIPKYALDSFSEGVFGFHGSCAYLPFGRGRSPMNWSIIKGDKRFILNLFKYDEYADSPNVFANRMFEINEHDTIRTLQYKNLICSYEMVKELWEAFLQKNIKIIRESKDFDSLYLKRTAKDGKIDFMLRTAEIYNLIRGVTKPFPGAFAYLKDKEGEIVRIWDAAPFDSIINFSEYQVGEVVEIYDQQLIVRTLDGSIIVKNYECKTMIKKGDVLQ